jgi:hypothetical protein
MKKIIFALIMLFIPVSKLLDNPIVSPKAFISELKFEGSNKWLLEIGFQFSVPYRKSQYDSICVTTTSGFTRIRMDNIADSTAFFVITVDSLVAPISINSNGDCVKLYSYFYGRGYLRDSLIFGNYPGSTIDSLPIGYSITRISYSLFSKDRNPTMGLQNDTIGSCGTLRGHIYDKDNNPITKGILILENLISLYNDGTYSTNVHSRKVSFASIYQLYQGVSIRIDSLKLNINPGCLYEKDIHLLDTLIVGVEKNRPEPDYEISIMNYPNPFNPSTNFVVTIPSSLKYAKKQINIYNVLGQKINSLIISNQLQIQWDCKDYTGKTASSGIYYYQLVLDNRIYKSGSMTLLK